MERGWNPNVETSPNCPRCGSCNTKFCYYNNYSLTQPRYFCKGCRRHWTRGGSLRNVPVGGGCRRSRRSGKSIRLSSDRDPPRIFFPYGNHNRFKNDHFTFSGSKSETGNIIGSAAGNIDIAQVYANFLNHQPAGREARFEMTGLPPCGPGRDDRYPYLISQQFASGVSNFMPMEFSCSTDHDHLPLENSLLEYPCNNNSGFDSLIHKQQAQNYGLPPWIGEMMDPDHILNIAPQMPEAAGIEQGSAQNSDHFTGNNYGNSVYASTSGYGTLFGP